MSDYPTFLTVDDVLAIHQRVIREFGGNPDVRDYGLLESAVAMPAARFRGEFLHEGEAAMAGAYLFHICKNHAFVDGSETPPAGAGGILALQARSACALRAAATSPGRSLEFYAAV